MIRTLLLSVVASLFLTGNLLAGANSQGRVWLSWDRSGLISELPSAQFNNQDLFLQIEDAPQITALALDVRFQAADSLCTFQVTSASPDSEVGWATESETPTTFMGDSTYTWEVSFPPTSIGR